MSPAAELVEATAIVGTEKTSNEAIKTAVTTASVAFLISLFLIRKFSYSMTCIALDKRKEDSCLRVIRMGFLLETCCYDLIEQTYY